MVSINQFKKVRLGAVFELILQMFDAMAPALMRRCKKRFGVCLCLGGLLWAAWPHSALAEIAPEMSPPEMSPAAVLSEPTGASLFSLSCAGCHAHGGNIVRRGKNLKQKTLVRNGYAEPEAIAQIITQGKGIMPAYADRLTAEEIEAIALYVHQQAESGW